MLFNNAHLRNLAIGNIFHVYSGARVGESVESALSALAAIFSALSAYLNNFRQKILYFDVSRQKRVLFSLALTGSLPVSLWLSMALCDSHSGSLWL